MFDVALLDVLLRASTLIGGGLAVWAFLRTAKVRRAEWLSTLHAKFFESPNYKNVRQILDYKSEPAFSNLRSALTTGEFDPLVEELVDYLNFFELVASLRKLGQLRPKEVSMLFHYYLSLLCRDSFIRQYIQTEDFENLDALLKKCVIEAKP